VKLRKLRTLGVRGQSMGIDLLFAVTMFLLIIGVVFTIWSNSTAVADKQLSEIQMRRMAERALNQLVTSKGSPDTWDSSYCGISIDGLGLAKRNLVLDENKLNQFIWRNRGLTRGLVGRWNFEGNLRDSSGNINHGTENPPVVYDSGLWGTQSVNFQPNGYGSVSYDPELGSDELTASFWVKFDDLTGIQAPLVMVGPIGGYLFILLTDKMAWRTTDGAVWETLESTVPLDTINWFFVAATIDSTGRKIYVNETMDRDSSQVYSTTGDVELLLGSGLPPHGVMDDIRIYNRALASNEILSLCDWNDIYLKEKLLIADNNFFFRLIEPGTGMTLTNDFGDLIEAGLATEDSREPENLLVTSVSRIITYKESEAIAEFTLHRIR